MIGAPDIDQGAKTAIDLDLVIGDIGGKIGVAAVRFLQRPVDIVAESGRFEEFLLAILPILDGLALRRRQAPDIDEIRGAKLLDRGGDLIAAALRQRPLGEEDFMRDGERGEIGADHLHHAGDRGIAHVAEPLAFRLIEQRAAILLRQRRADGLEIIAGIKPLGNSPIASPSASR